MSAYQEVCGRSIRRLVNEIHVTETIAYEMIRMTAMLMDLPLDDEQVVSMILQDCGVA